MACLCEVVEIEAGFDGFFYHKECGLQVDGMRATDNDDQLVLTKEEFMVSVRRVVIKPEAQCCTPRPKLWETLEDGVGPTYPDNPSNDYCFTEIRKTYVMGIQIMIQLQIKALVEDFKVCPLVIDMIQPVWLTFLNSTQLLSDKWAKKTIKDTKSEFKGEIKAGAHKGEPCNLFGKRCVTLWYRSLSNKIPLYYSLAICFLGCHLAREPILSTDIIKWALEGKLPYFVAYVEINKLLELPTVVCPLTSTSMFRPVEAIPIQKLQTLAASIAQSIGLELPPVNFSAIASRYLKQLSLPINIILPHACRIYEWSMPPELWLSANEFRLPTHAFILCILVVSIRILYNIHGFGKWEMSLTNVDEVSPRYSSQSEVDGDNDSAAEPCNTDLDATKILVLLQSKYNELIDASDHAKDLEAYLEYCETVVFAEDEKMKGLSYEDGQEDEMIKEFWQFYKDKKEDNKATESCFLGPSSPHKRPQDHSQSNTKKTKKRKEEITIDTKMSHKDGEIRRMKSNMEENKFRYIPPRKRVKRHDYLHYTRKKGVGRYVYAAHADYYILLRSCARVAQIDVRSMHAAVLSFERRLGWLENNIQHSFKLMPFDEDCQLCDFSHLNL